MAARGSRRQEFSFNHTAATGFHTLTTKRGWLVHIEQYLRMESPVRNLMHVTCILLALTCRLGEHACNMNVIVRCSACEDNIHDAGRAKSMLYACHRMQGAREISK